MSRHRAGRGSEERHWRSGNAYVQYGESNSERAALRGLFMGKLERQFFNSILLIFPHLELARSH